MKKAIFVGTSTVVGVVGVLSYTPPAMNANALSGIGIAEQTPTSTQTPSSTPSATQSSTPTPTQSSTPDATATATPKATKSATPTQTQSAAPSTPSGLSGTFDGGTAQTRYGPVQVRIVVENGKITAASALQYPNRDNRSVWINQQAVPWLVNQTLKAQSANLDGVGGATYTTNGWISSLANALSKAGL